MTAKAMTTQRRPQQGGSGATIRGMVGETEALGTGAKTIQHGTKVLMEKVPVHKLLANDKAMAEKVVIGTTITAMDGRSELADEGTSCDGGMAT